MKSKLEQHPDFPRFNANKDPIALITEMQNIVCRREAHMQDAWSLCKLIKFIQGSISKGKQDQQGVDGEIPRHVGSDKTAWRQFMLTLITNSRLSTRAGRGRQHTHSHPNQTGRAGSGEQDESHVHAGRGEYS